MNDQTQCPQCKRIGKIDDPNAVLSGIYLHKCICGKETLFKVSVQTCYHPIMNDPGYVEEK
jgi:hypothetical protein